MVLLALGPAACSTTDDGELRVDGVLNPADFPDCESDGSCREPLICAQLVNLPSVDRSPPLCLGEDICERLICDGEQCRPLLTCDRGQCRVTNGFPAQVRCVVD